MRSPIRLRNEFARAHKTTPSRHPRAVSLLLSHLYAQQHSAATHSTRAQAPAARTTVPQLSIRTRRSSILSLSKWKSPNHKLASANGHVQMYFHFLKWSPKCNMRIFNFFFWFCSIEMQHNYFCHFCFTNWITTSVIITWIKEKNTEIVQIDLLASRFLYTHSKKKK